MSYNGGTAAPALSFGDLEALWTNACGNAACAAVAPIMAAIAQAESSGIPNNLNPNDSNVNGGTQASAGLWQISNGTTTPIANWWDPATNATAAVAKFNSGGFGQWGAFTNHSFLPFLQDAIANGQTTAAAATTALGSGSALAPVNSSSNPNSTNWDPASAYSTPKKTADNSFTPVALSSATATMLIVFCALVLLIGIWAMTRSSSPAAAPKLADA